MSGSAARVLAARIAFRFSVIYFSIYVPARLLSFLIILPGHSSPPPPADFGPLRWMTEWTARNVFSVTQPLVVNGTGSWDKIFDWVQTFCFLLLAAIGTAIWSLRARRVANDITIHKWFHVFLRFSLGATLVSYGAIKVLPLQMPFPPLTRLLKPFGHFSPMGLLWYSIGVSRGYELFAGCAELAAGILLFIPHTRTLGALLSLACTIQIFALNMTYDVPLKLFSIHMVLMSMVLLAPEAKRLGNVVFDRPAERSTLPLPGKTARSRRLALIAQLAAGAYLVGMNLKGSVDEWMLSRSGTKPPLYGIWNVSHMTVDGMERPALLTDVNRWRRVVFDVPTRVSFQRMDDRFVRFHSTVDEAAKSIVLTRRNNPKWRSSFTFDRPADGILTMNGEMDGKKIGMRLELFPLDRFLLVRRRFDWVQDDFLKR